MKNDICKNKYVRIFPNNFTDKRQLVATICHSRSAHSHRLFYTLCAFWMHALCSSSTMAHILNHISHVWHVLIPFRNRLLVFFHSCKNKRKYKKITSVLPFLTLFTHSSSSSPDDSSVLDGKKIAKQFNSRWFYAIGILLYTIYSVKWCEQMRRMKLSFTLDKYITLVCAMKANSITVPV